jgi:hypothetical protein
LFGVQNCSISSRDLFFVSGTIVITKIKHITLITANVQKVYAPPNPLRSIGVNCPMAQFAPHKNIIVNPTALALKWFGKISGIIIQGIGPIEIQNTAVNPMIKIISHGPAMLKKKTPSLELIL